MTRSQSLQTALAADGGVTGLVASRIYPLVGLPPQVNAAPPPPVLIYKFDVSYSYVLSGVRKIDASLEMRSWATDYDVAHALADAVQAVLMPSGQPKGFTGTLGGAGGIQVIGCLIDKETDGLVAISPDQFVFEVVSLYGLSYVL